MSNTLYHIKIEIFGLVQGVGFRPFVYREAKINNISGWVKNRYDGIIIEASGEKENIQKFIYELKNNPPVATEIQRFNVLKSNKIHKNGFKIVPSHKNRVEREITQISPDIAVCDDCLKDINQQPHRINYPLINCTKCGPRFSIIRDLPYDRDKTTMDIFEMCPVCRSEYEDPGDRRFHAQPVACNNCGPKYRFVSAEKNSNNFNEIINLTTQFIDEGKIVAIKGIGGFFMACDATNAKVVERLRKKKNREGKPFAVMFRDLPSVREFCELNVTEENSLKSWQRPIVILKSKNKLPAGVSNAINTVGSLLPYMPFHFLLFEKLTTPAIIFTSGNFSDEPIVISNQKAENELMKISAAVVSNNREIYNRTDDSLLQIVNNKPRMMRRSRGFVPNPVYLLFNTDGILATGAELKNTFCIGKGNQAILSQHIGDLKDFETFSFYEKNIQQFQKMFRMKPKLLVCDLHPEYLSTKYSLELGLPVVQVQHHHAHVASALAEHGLDEKVIGVSFDGTGFGDDGNIWGSEFFICDLGNYERKLHFEYIPLPGGDLVAKEPWRVAISWLYKIFGKDFLKFNLPFLKTIDKEKTDLVLKAIENDINCPLSSGAGRMFDAVSTLLGLCNYSTFDAEAPMRLENIANHNIYDFYSYKLSGIIEFQGMFAEIIDDLKQNSSQGIISAKFHNTISEIIIAGIQKINKETGLKKVVLSGGTFQNKYILERTENKLKELGFQVFANCAIPCNDGGISLGQLTIAAKKRSLNFK